MDMSGYRPELSHVAQQSRRDKLRFLQASNPSHHLDSNLPNHPINPDVIHVRNVRNANLLYDPTMFSSEMLNFSINANNACHDEDLVASGETTQSNFGNWRSLNQPQNLDWSNNYTTSNHHNQMFGREENNNNAFFPSSQKLHLGSSTMHFPSSPHHPPLNYVNALQDVVTLASTGSSSSSQDQLEMTSLVHQRIMENELVLLPSYASQSNNALRFDNGGNYNSWMENRSNWSSSAGGGGRRGDPNQQGLSLSLSSNPPSNKNPASQYDVDQGFKDVQNSKTKPSMISKQPCEKPLQDIVGVMTTCGNSSRSTGPLGPFTGYATILKSSKFLKPAQQLLDEFCRTSDSKLKTYEASDERMSGEASASASASVSVSHDAVNAIDTKMRTKGNNSGGSSSTFYGSNEISSDGGGAASLSTESIRPEFQQKKAKLLYMQEEVCRRYKQYHQQMQMVVSSFETVAGLSSSTPYISMALNTVSRHFRCLTNSIKDQLRHIRKALGEEYLSSTVGTTSTRSGCSNKGDKNLGKLKHMGVGFQSHNYNKTSGGGSHVGFPEPQQHVWRPQRGLPERSVAILRAWLFEHFLHPYPTDTDKHMLATQTGLSRNQVSNWFINARVRVWKPMVEEIHMLETREGGQEQNPIPTNKDANCATDQATTSRTHSHNNDHQLLECSGDVEQSHHEMKRSRVECSRVPSSMDPGLMGFVPYQRGRLEVGGLGAVSLTLGLRHGVETAQQQQQQQQQQQHEDQLRRQLGGQMIRDFAG